MFIRVINPNKNLAYKYSQEGFDCSNNPLPIARGYNGDWQTGSSPGSRSLLLQTFPRRVSQWHTLDSLPITVAGPRRHYTGLPY